MSYGKEEQLPL